jgi:hypothetical protein
MDNIFYILQGNYGERTELKELSSKILSQPKLIAALKNVDANDKDKFIRLLLSLIYNVLLICNDKISDNYYNNVFNLNRFLSVYKKKLSDYEKKFKKPGS